MTHLPNPLSDYLSRLAVRERSLAYLKIASDGTLAEFSGPHDRYGISGLKKGEDPSQQVPLLVGCVPATSVLVLPIVEIQPSQYAEVHIVPSDNVTWVCLLDATAEALERFQLQQRLNEDELRRRKSSAKNDSTQENSVTVAAAVLQCELRGFSSLSERRNATETMRLLTQYLEGIVPLGTRFQGELLSLRGDVMQFVFGAKVHQNPAAVLAVQSGLAMIDEARNLQAELGKDERRVGVSLGVATGRLTLSEWSCLGQRRTIAVGFPLEVAQALQFQAGPNELLVDQDTFEALNELASTFEKLERPITPGGVLQTVYCRRVGSHRE